MPPGLRCPRPVRSRFATRAGAPEAQPKLGRAEAAMQRGDYENARILAEQAQIDADRLDGRRERAPAARCRGGRRA